MHGCIMKAKMEKRMAFRQSYPQTSEMAQIVDSSLLLVRSGRYGPGTLASPSPFRQHGSGSDLTLHGVLLVGQYARNIRLRGGRRTGSGNHSRLPEQSDHLSRYCRFLWRWGERAPTWPGSARTGRT